MLIGCPALPIIFFLTNRPPKRKLINIKGEVTIIITPDTTTSKILLTIKSRGSATPVISNKGTVSISSIDDFATMYSSSWGTILKFTPLPRARIIVSSICALVKRSDENITSLIFSTLMTSLILSIVAKTSVPSISLPILSFSKSTNPQISYCISGLFSNFFSILLPSLPVPIIIARRNFDKGPFSEIGPANRYTMRHILNINRISINEIKTTTREYANCFKK